MLIFSHHSFQATQISHSEYEKKELEDEQMLEKEPTRDLLIVAMIF